MADHLRQLPDDEIIKRVRQGDINAFEWIVKRYETSVANIIYGILGNVANAEDLGQEIFIRAYKGLKNFKHRAQFKTYLTRIAINVCRDAMKRKIIHMVPIQEETQFNESLMEDAREEFDVKDMIHAALFQLEHNQRMVVIFRIMEGYSTKETAQLLTIPEGTVLSRLSRGLDKLREILKEEWYLISHETN